MTEQIVGNWWNTVDLTNLLVWVLAAVSLSWLRYEATVWEELGDVFRRLSTPWEFIKSGASCHICSTYWITAPVIYFNGLPVWLAVNGAYLLVSRYLPTLDSDDEDEEMED